jgi:hypothetical protein
MFSKRSAAVVRSGILETNVSVPFKVVPTGSARVIAVEVAHSNRRAHALTENEMFVAL